MKIIKEYINNNKSILLIFIVYISFLFVHNYAYCDLSFFQKWYLNIENYFLTLTWEKAISDPIELSKSVGWISLGAIGSLYAFEGVWNAKLLGSKLLYYYTPFGHLDDISGRGASLFGLRNTAGPLKHVIDTVPYEEILPLYLARNYVFPYIFIKPHTNRENSNIINNNAVTEVNSTIRPETNSISVQVDLAPTVVTKEIEKPIYIPVTEYKDRENLLVLSEKIDRLASTTAESTLIKIGYSKGSNQIKDELNNIISSVEKDPSLLIKISYENDTSFMYEYQNGTNLIVSHDDFNFPLLKELLLTLHEYNLNNLPSPESRTLTPAWFYYKENKELLPYIELKYTRRSFLSGGGSDLSYDNCLLGGIESMEPIPLITQGIPFFLDNLSRVTILQDEQVNLVQELHQQIQNSLLTSVVHDQSTQTTDFGLNEVIFDRINSYLEIEDETSFNVASREGRNLPFNKLNAANMQAGIESKKNEKQLNNIETSMQTQTEPLISDNVEVFSASSNLFQNTATLFATILVGAIARDFQSIELVAKTILGFTHIPEYNTAFLAATDMSIADLKATFSFTQEEARKAYDALGAARDLRAPLSLPDDLSSYLSDSNNSLNQATNNWGWKDYLLLASGVIILGGTIYYMYHTVKNGSPTTSDVTQGVLSSFDVWEKQYIEKIRKL